MGVEINWDNVRDRWRRYLRRIPNKDRGTALSMAQYFDKYYDDSKPTQSVYDEIRQYYVEGKSLEEIFNSLSPIYKWKSIEEMLAHDDDTSED